MDEYFGRDIVKDNPHIETFGSQENDLADQFSEHLQALIRERKLRTTLERNTRQQGKITFLSHEISNLINSQYVLAYGGYQLPRSLFEPSQEAEMKAMLARGFSYLLGLYSRYGTHNTITLANAGQKADLAFYLLRVVGCERVQWTSRDTIPVMNKIDFEPNEELLAFLGTRYRDQRRADSF